MKHKHVHTEIIEFEGSTAIISGVPDKCKHVFNDTLYELSNGETLQKSKCLCPTDEATYEYMSKVADDKNAVIVGGMTCCSRCGKPEFTMYELMTQF